MFKLAVPDWICLCENIVQICHIIAKYFSKIIYKEKKHCTDCDKANAYIRHTHNEVIVDELTGRIPGVFNTCFPVC